jgi:predicted amidohydrolase YtcJ
VKKFVGTNTEIMDLEGKTVTPGFIDGHAHMDREGLKFLYPSLSGAKSIGDLLKIIEQEVKKRKPGEWIVTMPFGEYPFYSGTESPDFFTEKRFPNRFDLDRVSPENPVYIRGIWFYWRKTFPIVSIANSYALRLAEINSETSPPYEGLEIVKDEKTGEPTGVFKEWDQPATMEFSLMKVVPRFTHEERVTGLRDSMRRYNAVGTTSIYEGHGISSETLRAYKSLWEEDEMTVRSYLVLSPAWDAVQGGEVQEVLRDWAAFASGVGFGDQMLKVGGLWTFVGNPITERIRRKERPYTGWAGFGVDQSLPPERGSLDDLIFAAVSTGLRVNAITFNTPELESYLDALERINEKIPIGNERFVLQHLTFVSEAQQKQIQRLGIVPTLLPGGISVSGSENVKGKSENESNQYIPLKSFLERGVPFILGTDNKPINPLSPFQAAISRKDKNTGETIGKKQKISREDALKAITINGAYLAFEEKIKGSIVSGKLADLVILSEDLLTCPENGIEKIKVMKTMLGGKFVHSSDKEG